MFTIHPSTLEVLNSSVRADIDRQAHLRQVAGRGRRLTAQPAHMLDFGFATLVATMVALVGLLLIG